MLQRLHISACRITDECAGEVAPQLPSVMELNLMSCHSLSGAGLEAFGRHCGSLARLYITVNDGKCFTIARHMSKLKHLHVRYSSKLSRASIQAVLQSCTSLRNFVFESPCHEPRMSKMFLLECMRRRQHPAPMFFGCKCCRGYKWVPENDSLLEK